METNNYRVLVSKRLCKNIPSNSIKLHETTSKDKYISQLIFAPFNSAFIAFLISDILSLALWCCLYYIIELKSSNGIEIIICLLILYVSVIGLRLLYSFKLLWDNKANFYSNLKWQLSNMSI